MNGANRGKTEQIKAVRKDLLVMHRILFICHGTIL